MKRSVVVLLGSLPAATSLAARVPVTGPLTYEAPTRTSRGVVHVLVRGTPAVRDGQIVEGAAPGQPARAAMAARP